MLWWHVGMVEGHDGAHREGLGPATALTLGRAWLVPALPLVSGASWPFATLFAIGALADAADGPVARRRGEETRLGAHSDGTVDECFVLSAAWTAAAAGWLPTWAAVLVSARCVVPPLLIALAYFARAQAPPRAGVVPGRLPGVAVALGLALTAIEPARPAALALVLAGTAGGAVTAAASVRRVRRDLHGRGLDGRPVAASPAAREHAVVEGPRTIKDEA